MSSWWTWRRKTAQNINLMDQMRKIVRVTKSHLLIFMDEAIAWNTVVERMRLFNKLVHNCCSLPT
jgi:signal recognition particle GTPase